MLLFTPFQIRHFFASLNFLSTLFNVTSVFNRGYKAEDSIRLNTHLHIIERL